tara:strand:+ start:673 stop:1536 length:864 start_codon:yes stop_codon:yes gene_type:complete
MGYQTVGDFKKDGYTIIRNIIPNKTINTLLENISQLYCKFSNESEDEIKKLDEPFNQSIFHEKLINFRKEEPELFGAIYDSLKTSVALNQILMNDLVIDNVAKFLNVTPSDLSVSEPMCRLDVPEDKRNIISWHQERSFFPQNRDGLKGLVSWIPLSDIDEEMGAIHICPKSHEEGFLGFKKEEKENESYTTQIVVPQEKIKKYEDVVVPVKKGDAVFFNMLLFHRSGRNVSNKIRFAIQGRFHTMTSEDFIPFELNNYYNPFIKQKLEKKFDCSDIPNNSRQPPIA